MGKIKKLLFTCTRNKNFQAKVPAVTKIRKLLFTCTRNKNFQANVPAVTHHIRRQWECPINTPKLPAPQQGTNLMRESTTSHQCAPSPAACRLAAAWTAHGSDLALAHARPAMKRQVSSNQRPPNSHAGKTRRAFPCSSVSFG